MIQSYQRRLFITGMLSTISYSGYAQQSMLMSTKSTAIFDAKVDLKKSIDNKPVNKITSVKNRDTFTSSKRSTAKINGLKPATELPLKVLSLPLKSKNESKKLNTTVKFTFNKEANLYCFIPRLDYYPANKIGVHFSALLASPDVISLRINQMRKTYSIKMSFKF